MSGYKRVNYYELCRLCTSSDGTKLHIFREEGRRRQLPTKIQLCLPLQVNESDSLPKIICTQCADKLDSFYDFREACNNAEQMLERCLNTLNNTDELMRDGKVYVKDEPKKKMATNVHTDNKTNQNHQIKVATVTPMAATVPIVQSLTVETLPAIRIVNSEETNSFKSQLEDQQHQVNSIIEQSFSYQSCETSTEINDSSNKSNADSNNTNCSMLVSYNEGGTQTDFTDHVKDIKREVEISKEVLNNASVYAIPIAPHSEEILERFTLCKDKELTENLNPFRTEEALQRSSLAQIGEFLRMKIVQSLEDGDGLQIAMCETCGKEITSAEELHNHSLNCQPSATVSNENTDGKTVPCEDCGKSFKRKEHLFQHRKLHTGERPFTCPNCSKSFTRKEHLIRHAASHTGQKKFPCDMCGKSFSRKDNLRKHCKTHGINGPFVCEVCGKSFVIQHYYKLHLTTHSTEQQQQMQPQPHTDISNSFCPPDFPFRCEICDKGFNQKRFLTVHLTKHRNDNLVDEFNDYSPNNNNNKNDTDLLLNNSGPASINVINNNLNTLNQNATARNEQDGCRSTDEETSTTTLTTVNHATILPPNIVHTDASIRSTYPSTLFQLTSTTSISSNSQNEMLQSYDDSLQQSST